MTYTLDMKTTTLMDQLRSFMSSKGLTQWDVAVMLKTNQANISRWLSGANTPGGKMYARILELVEGKR